jgi:membrane protease YdiL (CAAX protease family)
VGAIHRYSNANYITLGMVVQTVAGQSYEAYVQERILGPVGMRRSYTSKDEARADGLASGHRYWFGVPVASDLPYPRGVLPAGYLIASVEDMARYLTLYQRGGRVGETAVLSPAGVAELVRPGAAAGGPEASYAMGWGVAQDGDVRVIGHAGETFDFRSAMSFVPERGLGMVLLMNADTALGRGRLTGIADGVYSLMLGREAPAPASNTPSVVLYTVLLGVVLVQVAGMVRSRIVLGRWTARPERRPRGRWGITRQIALPLATNLAWAALTLLLLPRLLGGSLALVTLQMPDVASVLLASGGVALAWAALRTALIVRLLWRGPRLRPGPAPAPVSRAGHGDALRPGPGRPRPGGARPHPGTPRRRPAVPALSPPHARGLGAEPPERSYPFFHLCQARRAPVTPGGWGRSPQQGPTPSSTRREEQRVYAAGATTTSAPLHRFPSAAEAARRRGPLRRLVARHPLAAYLVLAFAFAWGCIAPLLLSRRGLGVLPLDAPAAAVTAINSLASYVGLLLPAVLVTAAADGRGGVRDLLGRCLRWRAGLRWYLLALFGVPGAVVLAAIPLAGVAPLTGPTGTWALLVTLFVPGVLVPLLLINLPEEAGWTGFLQARLQARHGPVLASFLVAPAFALIHLPAYFVAGWIGEEKVPLARFPEALLSVAVTAGFAVFFRLLIMWLYNGGGGSVPVVALFHSVFNLSAGPRLTPVLVPGVDPAVLNLLTIAAVAAGAVVVAVATRGRLGWTGRPSAAGAAEPPVTPSR